jgi:hypothetical protein
MRDGITKVSRSICLLCEPSLLYVLCIKLYVGLCFHLKGKEKKERLRNLNYGQGQGFQGSALPVAKTESPNAIPAMTNAKINNLLSESNSILFIESPF